MRAILEDVQLGSPDAVLERLCEPHRGDGIVAPERDLGRSADLAELRFGIVGDHGIRLSDECVDRLCGAAPHEVG
jgi:hypothetical protein